VDTRVSSQAKEVIIGENRPTILIGERINPSGKKKLTKALQEGNFDIVRKEAITQVNGGADIIDVNVGGLNVDEVSLLPQVVKVVAEAVDAPMCLDSNNHKALEAAIKVYKGKPLLSSVTGEKRSLKEVLPLVKEYGSAVVGLTIGDNGIPNEADERVTIARTIVEQAERIGIPPEDIIIDCLALTVGADTRSGKVTIETIQKVKRELGVNLILGISNISFGLPDRNLLNDAFLAICIAAGVNCIIVDVLKTYPAVLAADAVLGRDRFMRRYIGYYKKSR
jgi:5-methyltetrahydrofolate--homocysteine methyltransferase